MDVARFRSLAEAVIADYDASNVVSLLKALQAAYTVSVQNPTSDTAAAYDAALAAFFEAAKAMKTVNLPASKLAMLEHLHAADLLGAGLVTRLEQILMYGVSPATIVENLEALRTRMAKFRKTLETVRNGLNELGVTSEDPPAGEAEAEITLPGKMFDHSLGGMARESKRLNDSLLVLVEAATGSRPPLTIRAVSTGSLDIVVLVDLASAVVILQVGVAILQIINSMLVLKKTQQDFQRQDAPPEFLKQIDEWHRTRIDAAVQKVRDDVLASIRDEPRRRELTSSTDTAIQYLADRIDRGMRINIEVSKASDGEDRQADIRGQLSSLERRMISLSSEVKQLTTAEPVLALLPPPAQEGAARSAHGV